MPKNPQVLSESIYAQFRILSPDGAKTQKVCGNCALCEIFMKVDEKGLSFAYEKNIKRCQTSDRSGSK